MFFCTFCFTEHTRQVNNYLAEQCHIWKPEGSTGRGCDGHRKDLMHLLQITVLPCKFISIQPVLYQGELLDSKSWNQWNRQKSPERIFLNSIGKLNDDVDDDEDY